MKIFGTRLAFWNDPGALTDPILGLPADALSVRRIARPGAPLKLAVRTAQGFSLHLVEVTESGLRLGALLGANKREIATCPLYRDGFKPMESAPKDGREIILKVALRAGIPGRMLVGHWMPGGHCIDDHPPIDSGWYFWNGRLFDKAAEPIAWMPLPE